MAYQVKVGSTWKDAIPHVKVGSAWKEVQEAYVKVGSTWKSVWVNWAFTHTINISSTNDYGVLVYGMNKGSSYNRNFGSISPSTVNATSILHMVADENGKCQIRMNSAMSDPEIHIELSNGGTKYIFTRGGSTSSYYNLSSGNKAAWLDMLRENHGDEISFKMWTQ